MSEVDRDALKRSIQAFRSGNPSHHRSATRRNIQPELSAIDRQLRKESLETVEGALTQAGIDVPKLRASLFRNQKKSVDRVAALRSSAERSPHSEFGASVRTTGRFQSLRAFGGRAAAVRGVEVSSAPAANGTNSLASAGAVGLGSNALLVAAPGAAA